MFSNKHIPLRSCVICKQKFPKPHLKRFVCTVDNQGKKVLQKDPKNKFSGRGFYLCPNINCQKKFAKYKGWQKKC